MGTLWRRQEDVTGGRRNEEEQVEEEINELCTTLWRSPLRACSEGVDVYCHASEGVEVYCHDVPDVLWHERVAHAQRHHDATVRCAYRPTFIHCLSITSLTLHFSSSCVLR